MSPSADRALENVQNLYVMQFQLLDLLESDLRDPKVRKEVRSQMKQFEMLLSKADWRYMGGLDVWETLKSLPVEMTRKLRESSVTSARGVTPRRKIARAARSPKVAVMRTKKAAGKKKRK